MPWRRSACSSTCHTTVTLWPSGSFIMWRFLHAFNSIRFDSISFNSISIHFISIRFDSIQIVYFIQESGFQKPSNSCICSIGCGVDFFVLEITYYSYIIYEASCRSCKIRETHIYVHGRMVQNWTNECSNSDFLSNRISVCICAPYGTSCVDYVIERPSSKGTSANYGKQGARGGICIIVRNELWNLLFVNNRRCLSEQSQRS